MKLPKRVDKKEFTTHNQLELFKLMLEHESQKIFWKDSQSVDYVMANLINGAIGFKYVKNGSPCGFLNIGTDTTNWCIETEITQTLEEYLQEIVPVKGEYGYFCQQITHAGDVLSGLSKPWSISLYTTTGEHGRHLCDSRSYSWFVPLRLFGALKDE